MDDREEVGGKDFKEHVKLNSCFLISLLYCTVMFVASLLYLTLVGVADVHGFQVKLGIRQW